MFKFVQFYPSIRHCILPAAAAAASFGSAAFAPASDMPLRHNFIHQLRSVSCRPMRRIERCSIKLGVRTPHPNTKLLFVSSPPKSSFFNILNHLENTCVFFNSSQPSSRDVSYLPNQKFPLVGILASPLTSAGASAGSP